jgi:hypothetical protein
VQKLNINNIRNNGIFIKVLGIEELMERDIMMEKVAINLRVAFLSVNFLNALED